MIRIEWREKNGEADFILLNQHITNKFKNIWKKLIHILTDWFS